MVWQAPPRRTSCDLDVTARRDGPHTQPRIHIMNENLMALIHDESLGIINVVFKKSSQRKYTYFCDNNLIAQLTKHDILIVPVQEEGFQCVYFEDIADAGDLHLDSDIEYKLVVGPIPDEVRMAWEARMEELSAQAKIFKNIKLASIRQELRQALQTTKAHLLK